MDPRRKASLLWGLVGALAYLVLVQGYHLLGGAFLGVTGMVGVALVVFLVSTLATYWLRPRLASWNERA